MARKKIHRGRSMKNASLTSLLSQYSGVGIVILLIIMMIASIILPSGTSRMRTATTDAMAPLIKTVSIPLQSMHLAFKDMTSLSELKAENERLKEDNEKLKLWYKTALTLEAENKTLNTLLNVKQMPEKEFVTAQVLSDSGSRFIKTLLVNAGIQDGLKKNQAVLTGEGMIGRVIEPGKKLSRILLITDIHSRIPVIVSQTNQNAVLLGNNTPNPTLDYVDADTNVKNGSVLLTSGRAGVFPYGLPIGTVNRDKDNGEYSVELFADVSRLLYVQILKQKTDTSDETRHDVSAKQADSEL